LDEFPALFEHATNPAIAINPTIANNRTRTFITPPRNPAFYTSTKFHATKSSSSPLSSSFLCVSAPLR
jgi:hypothetical protein